MADIADVLALIAHGFRVFPIAEGKRAPPLVEFTTQATRDPALAAAYFPPGNRYNVGIASGDGIMFADLDTKGGKQGPAEFAEMGGDFNRMVFATPSGGYHVPYLLDEDVGQSKPSPGIDVRCANGYIVGPGSYLDGSSGDGIVGGYRILRDGFIDYPPPGLAARLVPVRERKSRPVEDAPDTDDPRSIADAEHYLLHRAPVAVEGLNGDDTTYRVACAVRRDYGLSNERAYLLLAEHWNDRCSPPWPLDDLWQKVCHAEEYGTGAEGAASSARSLDKIVAGPSLDVVISRATGAWEFGNAIPENQIKARDWIMHRLLLRQALTALVATGSAGKTTLLLTLAALGAAGRALHEKMLCPKPFRSVIYDAEEPREELSRRLAAVCAVLKLDWRQVSQQIMLLGMDDVDFSLASGSPGQWTQHTALVEQLVAVASAPDVGLVGIGPLNKLSPLDVSDNTAMAWLMKLMGQIAVRADVALLFTHHTSKDADKRGDADVSAASALGAQSIISSVRIAYTMAPLSEDDMLDQRIAPEDAGRYVRLNDSKMNLTLKGSSPVVLHRAEHRLLSGDLIGALEPFHRVQDTNETAIVARAIHDLMGVQESGKVGISAVVARWQQLDPSRALVESTTLIKRLQAMLAKNSNRLTHIDETGAAHMFTSLKESRNRCDFVYADALTKGV